MRIQLPYGFVLKRMDQAGGYVALPGSPKSYVQDILKARVFSTYKEADQERCEENEIIVEVR